MGDLWNSAQSNSFSYNSSNDLSNNCGRAASSFFSSWICGEDCHISEVSWSASSSSSLFSTFLSFLLVLTICLELFLIVNSYCYISTYVGLLGIFMIEVTPLANNYCLYGFIFINAKITIHLMVFSINIL